MRLALSILGTSAALAGCGASPVCIARPEGSPVPVADPAIVHAESEIRGGETCLFTQSWAPASGEVRAVVVIVHGLRDHSTRYDAFARELAHHGYEVHAGDLQGHGRSGGERQFIDSLEKHVADVMRVIAAARALHPSHQIFLFGHSMGGAIATLVAIEHPEAIQGLILSAPALEVNPGTSDFDLGLAHFFAGVLPHADATTLDGRRFSRDVLVREADDRDPLVVRSALPARTVSAIVRAIEIIRRRAAEIAHPLLLLHGDEDQITPPGGTGRLYVEASSSDRTFHLYHGLYHDLLHEPEHEQVVADILTWLDSHS